MLMKLTKGVHTEILDRTESSEVSVTKNLEKIFWL